MKIYLYSTVGCHLCEQAKAILWPLLQQYQCQLVEIDIADDDSLIETYGIRIPVLSGEGYSEDLGWPFNESQADTFLTKLTQV